MTHGQASADEPARVTPPAAETVAVFGAGGTMGFAMARNIARAGIGELVVLESGPADARPRVQPVFDAIGHRTIAAGQAGAGTRLKLVTSSWVLALVEAAAETIALADGLGVDPSLFFQAVEGGPLDLPYLRIKGHAMTERDFTPSFRLSLAAKDAALVTDAAWQHGVDLPLPDVVARRLGEAVAEHGDEDISATYLTSAPERAA